MREEIPNLDPGSLVRVQAHPVLSRCWLGSVGRMEFLVECSGRGSQRWRATLVRSEEAPEKLLLESATRRSLLRLMEETAWLLDRQGRPLLEALVLLRKAPPLRAVRISSAAARGYAKNFAYWGVARYRITWSPRWRWPVALPEHAAPSSRRSFSLAELDALEVAGREKRFLVRSIGRLQPDEVTLLAQAYRNGTVKPA